MDRSDVVALLYVWSAGLDSKVKNALTLINCPHNTVIFREYSENILSKFFDIARIFIKLLETSMSV